MHPGWGSVAALLLPHVEGLTDVGPLLLSCRQARFALASFARNPATIPTPATVNVYIFTGYTSMLHIMGITCP